ncbi:hypothetical protein C1645_825348 [Glomus cerebriforme]|uniref:SAM domain-containing protein n=1 Tax=Glomus cerebriforme TaxID=658196 RepID=A0A397T229_9GLOM|nr:hypothetical protein C1645_825348 [Glomus cerebriforme]
MSHNIANTSTSTSTLTASLPTVEQMKTWSQDNVKTFLQENRIRLDLEDKDINKIYTQRIKGSTFLDFTAMDFERWGVPSNSAKEIEKLINEIKREQPVTGLAILKNLDDKIDLIRSELENIYELSARSEIAKINGSYYSSNHADKISNYIYNKKMKMKLKESILYIRSLPQNKNFIKSLNILANRAEKALNDWEAHETKSTSSENHLYLANTKFLGIMLITSYIMDPKIAIENNHAPFDEVLELDICERPTSYFDMKNISIEIEKIKLMTKNLLHDYRQLLIRLAVLGFAIEALNSEGDKIADYRCNLVGILYVPKVSSIINIPNEWENGIKFSKGSNHAIKIVAIGDKP